MLPSGSAPPGLHKRVPLMLTFDDCSTVHTGLSLELHGKPGAQPNQDSYEIRLCAEDPKDYTTLVAQNHLFDLKFAHNVYSEARRSFATGKITTMDRGVHIIAQWLWGFCRQTCPYRALCPCGAAAARRPRPRLAPAARSCSRASSLDAHQDKPAANASWRRPVAASLSTTAADEAPLPLLLPLTDHVKKVPGGYMVLCKSCGADTTNIKTVDAKGRRRTRAPRRERLPRTLSALPARGRAAAPRPRRSTLHQRSRTRQAPLPARGERPRPRPRPRPPQSRHTGREGEAGRRR